MSLPGMLVNTVSLVKYGSPQNVLGQNVPTSTVVENVKASVQQTSAASRFDQDIDGATASGKAFFASDPGVKVDDQILWAGRTLVVVAPAADEAGRGICYSVNWRETV